MNLQRSRTPTAVLLLADHLDAMLAAGEELAKLGVDIEGARKSDGATAPWARFEPMVAGIKSLELALVARALQARLRAREAARDLMRAEPMIGRALDGFAAGLVTLEDAISELADRVSADFDAGLDPLAYMRTRGMIAADAGSLTGLRQVGVTDTFLVARRIELGPLLDMTAALLDVLDVRYSLFEDDSLPADDEATRMREAEAARGEVRELVETVTEHGPSQS